MKRRTNPASFREELQQTFLTYALIPIVLAVVVVLCILWYLLVTNVICGSKQDASAVTARIDAIVEACEGEAEELAERIDSKTFMADAKTRSDILYEVYSFLNRHKSGMAFYMMDGNGELLFTTERKASRCEACMTEIDIQLIRVMQRDGTYHATKIARNVRQDESSAYLLICRRLIQGDGYVCFALPDTSFEVMIDSIGSYITVTDELGYIFTSEHPDYTVILGKLDKTVRYRSGLLHYADDVYYQAMSMGDGFVVYAVRECGDVILSALVLTSFAVGVFLITALAAALSARHIAARKTKLIDEITQACRKVQAGDLMTRLEISSHDEFEVIGDAYNSMLESIRSLMARSVELAEQNAVTRVKQLESHFQPHFLYNTLENVRFLIRIDPKAAEEMTVDLSRLLRYSISPAGQVTLSEDMDYTRRYLRLLKIRYGDRLCFTIDMPQELGETIIPRLIAQPVIENAVKYGIDDTDVLQIEVIARKDGDDLLLTVRDNGIGIEAETLARIREQLEHPDSNAREHIGILNVHERIRLTYGEAYGITLESETDHGTLVTMRFPLHPVNVPV